MGGVLVFRGELSRVTTPARQARTLEITYIPHFTIGISSKAIMERNRGSLRPSLERGLFSILTCDSHSQDRISKLLTATRHR